MSELVTRLSTGTHRLVFGPADQEITERLATLRAAIDRQYVCLTFPHTRGGTELGVPLDSAACDLGGDFARAEGVVRLEGDLELDFTPVRMVATLDLKTLEGEGQLRIRDRPAAVPA